MQFPHILTEGQQFQSHKVINNDLHPSIKPLLVHFEIVAFLLCEVFVYLRAPLRYWMFIYPFILANKKDPFFSFSFCGFHQLRAVHRLRRQDPPSSQRSKDLWAKNLQREPFCPPQMYKPLRLAFSPPFHCSALPFH